MTTVSFTRLKGINFTDPTLPVIRDFGTDILAIPGLRGWWDAEDTLLDSTGKIDVWRNRKPNGPRLTLGGTSRAGLIADTTLGRSVADFSVANPIYYVLSEAWAGAGPWTMICVSKPDPGSSAEALLGNFVLGGPPAGNALLWYNAATIGLQLSNSTFVGRAPASAKNNWHHAIAGHDGAGLQSVVIDGLPAVTGGPPSTPASGISVFRVGNNVANLSLKGRISAILLFDASLFASGREADLATLQAFLAAAYPMIV